MADERVSSCFRHQGHRTAEAQRALRSRAGPWLGHTTLDGVGQVVAEVPPHSAGLDWNDVNEPAELRSIMQDLGRAVARMHAVPESGHDLVGFSTEEAIMRVIGHDRAGFAGMPVDFAHRYGAQARADHRLFADLFRNGRLPGGRAADLATDQLVWQAPRT